MTDPVLIAAVEGGGTSFVVAVADISRGATNDDEKNYKNNIRILHRAEIDSSHNDPNKTLMECASFFRKHKHLSKDGYRSLGVGMFGPVGCNIEKKEEYGKILSTTPKKNWRGVDVLSPLIEACQSESNTETKTKLAVKIDTDVNAPAVAEYLKQQSENREGNETKSISSLAYVTIGTGVGVGLVINGKPVHGMMHPEGGHVPVQPLQGDNFTGYSWGADSKSPFRGKHTVESMTSSVALTERLEQIQRQANMDRGCLADLDDDDHEIWDHASNALANLCVTLALVTSIEKIVLGGGIMKRNGLIEKVRRQTRVLLNGYLGDLSDQDLTEWITSSTYGSDAGLMGAFVLAQQAIAENNGEECVLERETSKKLKQVAYNSGVWHGFLLGLSAAYVGLIMYVRSGKPSSRR